MIEKGVPNENDVFENNDDGTICEHGTKTFPLKWTMKVLSDEWFLPCNKVWLNDYEWEYMWAHMSMWCKAIGQNVKLGTHVYDLKYMWTDMSMIYVMQNGCDMKHEWWHIWYSIWEAYGMVYDNAKIDVVMGAMKRKWRMRRWNDTHSFAVKVLEMKSV